MAAPRTVAVFGAFGNQGGSVAMALLKDGSFKVRAITRNPRKKAVQELKRLGAEIVKADLDNEKSLLEALKDVYGVFLVTDYWEYMDKDREVQQVLASEIQALMLPLRDANFIRYPVSAAFRSGGKLQKLSHMLSVSSMFRFLGPAELC
ncbi:nmrA-like family domain-containing protein 1 [Rhincodon typus]|uniref:nmrA-like family domain-containing protein 1 n=1 Tax=Rhincodon typus TaxID=259920 RepID=UPI00202DEDA7|nr:nmrA-like family domain-containing protein 1 [Rhincodon typus]